MIEPPLPRWTRPAHEIRPRHSGVPSHRRPSAALSHSAFGRPLSRTNSSEYGCTLAHAPAKRRRHATAKPDLTPRTSTVVPVAIRAHAQPDRPRLLCLPGTRCVYSAWRQAFALAFAILSREFADFEAGRLQASRGMHPGGITSRHSCQEDRPAMLSRHRSSRVHFWAGTGRLISSLTKCWLSISLVAAWLGLDLAERAGNNLVIFSVVSWSPAAGLDQAAFCHPADRG